MTKLVSFLRDEKGATAIEYGLIASLISVAIAAVLLSVGSSLTSTFTSIKTNLDASKPAT